MAYWYLEESYPVNIAVTGGLILAILEITLEKIFTKHVHTLSKLNFFLILFLGGLSLLGEDGLWFKLQPFFTGVAISGFLSYRLFVGKGLLVEMTEILGQSKIPDFVLTYLEKHMAFFFLAYGIFMGALALFGTTGQWAFFKTLGFYGIFVVFMIFEMILLRFKLKKMMKYEQSRAILSRFSHHP